MTALEATLCVFVFFSFVSGLRKLGNFLKCMAVFPQTGLMIFCSEKRLLLCSVDKKYVVCI